MPDEVPENTRQMVDALKAHFELPAGKRGAAVGGTKILSVELMADGVHVAVEVNGVIRAVVMPHPHRGYVEANWAAQLERLLR